MAQTVKNLPAMQETRVQSLGGEDPLEKEMATDSSILAWKIPWTGKSGGLQSMGLQRVGHDRSDLAHTHAKGGRRDSLDQQEGRVTAPILGGNPRAAPILTCSR